MSTTPRDVFDTDHNKDAEQQQKDKTPDAGSRRGPLLEKWPGSATGQMPDGAGFWRGARALDRNERVTCERTATVARRVGSKGALRTKGAPCIPFALALLVSMTFGAGNALASDVVIVDRTEQIVREVKLQTGRERETYMLQAGADLGPPFGIFVDEAKNTYVTRQGNAPDYVGSVEVKYNGSDSFQTLVPADPNLNGGLGRPFYPIVRGATLFVSSWLTHEILMFDTMSGESLGAFVDVGEGGLVNPRGLRFGPDGDLYVNSSGTHETLVYDGESGEYLWETKERLVREQCGAVCGLDRASNGRILAATTQLEVQEIRSYSYSMKRDELEHEVLRSGTTMSDVTPRHLSN